MDDRLQKALDHANYASTIHQQKKLLEMKFENDIMYSINGGTFRATPELISFVSGLNAREESQAVLITVKNTPVLIEDLKAFETALRDTYHEATLAYYLDSEALRKSRTVKAAVGA